MAELAIRGGRPVRDSKTQPWPVWPVWGKEEEETLLDVLHSGVWSYNGPKEKEFNRRFAEYTGVNHVISAANGTVTLQLALEALGIGLGDEVIVPGLTWQATAAAVIDINAVPVLVDVCEETWCIDPVAIEKAITPGTKAIIPVHLYGNFAEMDAILKIAQKHHLSIVEDCAHKHGGEWNHLKAGSIGDIGSFSFQLSKHLTAGEGGALTTNNPEVAEKLDALRNCGRRPEAEDNPNLDKGAGTYSDEGNFIQSGNYRITEFQAALLVEGLKRLPEQNRIREENATYLNTLLSGIPGVFPMYHDPRETKKAYFNFSFRYKQEEFRGISAGKFRKALEREIGIGVEASYEPLNNCPLYVPHTKPARYRANDIYWQQIDPQQVSLPVCERIYAHESVCIHHKILLGEKRDMETVAEAIQKIYKYSGEIEQG